MENLGRKVVEFRTLPKSTEWKLYVTCKELDRTNSKLYALEWRYMFLEKEYKAVCKERDHYRSWYLEEKDANFELLKHRTLGRSVLVATAVSVCLIGLCMYLAQ